jgi:hypothetical protein
MSMRRQLLTIAALLLALPLRLWCADAGGNDAEKWSMEDSFANGIPSWQSYPLAQDIGYDPSIYTATSDGTAVLVRDVINEGQKTQSVGMIRPLKFRLTASTQITLDYSLRLAGEPVAAKLILAAEDGTRFEAALPLQSQTGRVHMVRGSTLLAERKDADIQAVVILCSIRGAPLGAHSLLTLRSFAVSAMRSAELSLLSPHLLQSSGGTTPIAEGFVSAGQPAHFSLSSVPQSVVIKDGAGAVASAAVAIDGSEVRWTPAKSAAPGLWTIEVAGRHAGLRFATLVLPAATGDGVIFSAERINQLRTDSRFAGLRQAIHREAARQAAQIKFNPLAGDSIALLPSQSVHAGLTAYIALMNSYGGTIAYGALDYRLTGDRESLESVRKALAAVAAWKTWTPTWFTAHGMHTYYVVGVFTEQLAVGYDLVSDQLSPGDRAAIEHALLSKSIQPAIDDYFLRQRMPTSASNHMAHSIGGAIAAWAACARANSQWRTQQGTALAELLVAYQGLLKGLFPGDGSEREPAGYEIFAMEGMTYGISALKSLGIVPDGASKMMESFWWLRYAEVKPELVLDTGDTGSTLAGLYGYAWVAEHSDDPGARWLYDSVARPAMEPSLAEIKERDAPPNLLAISRAPNVLDLLCCTHAAAPAPTPPPSRIFPLRGSAVLRQGWAEDQTVISLRVGPWMNHEHHDQGSFQLASRGELLVGEGSYADYYRDPNYKDYFSEAAGHNVVLLDGDAFSQIPYDGVYYKAFAKYPRVTSSLLTDRIDYLDADLQPAYGDTLRRYRRTFLFFKPDLLVVSDDLKANAPMRFEWLLHAAPGANVARKGNDVSVEGREGRASVTALAANQALHWQISAAPIAINDFTDLDRVRVLEHEELSLASEPSLSTRFLVGLSVASSSGQTKDVATVERHGAPNADGFLQKRADQQTVVLYRKSSGDLAASGVTTDGEVLAVSLSNTGDEAHVFAARAGYLRVTGLPGLSFASTENIVLDRTHREVTLNLDLDKPSSLRFEGAMERGSLELDGTRAVDIANGHGLTLESGKHRIRFTLVEGRH